MPDNPSDYYRAYSPDTAVDDARAAFTVRYGREPAEVREVPGLVLAGPVPREEAEPWRSSS